MYVLHQDVAWQLLPLELGFGSRWICWRRPGRWQQAGVFDRLHRILLAELNAAAGHLSQGRPEPQGPGQTPLRRRAGLRPPPPVQTPRHPIGTTPLELHDAFVSLACSRSCWRRLKKAHP
ncbi:hypothetical protein [Streptomyces sviceus]|uniref:hypothetical protein n=1 Tax=Streptomyces sviceus TaxID=285530 RepID=UPI0036AD9511